MTKVSGLFAVCGRIDFAGPRIAYGSVLALNIAAKGRVYMRNFVHTI